MFSDENINLKTNWKFLKLTKVSLNTEASSTHFITLVLHTVMECTLEGKIASHALIMCTESPYGAIQKRENVLLENRRLIQLLC